MDCVKCCLHYFYIRSCDRTTNCPGCTLTATAGVSSVDPVTLRSVTLMLTLSPNPFEAAVLFSSLRRRKIKVPSCKIHKVGFLWAIDRLAHSSQCTLHFNAKVPQTVLKDCFMQARPGTGLCFLPFSCMRTMTEWPGNCLPFGFTTENLYVHRIDCSDVEQIWLSIRLLPV